MSFYKFLRNCKHIFSVVERNPNGVGYIYQNLKNDTPPKILSCADDVIMELIEDRYFHSVINKNEIKF